MQHWAIQHIDIQYSEMYYLTRSSIPMPLRPPHYVSWECHTYHPKCEGDATIAVPRPMKMLSRPS